MLDPELEDALGDADALGRHRGAKARRLAVSVRGRRAPQRARRVDRLHRLSVVAASPDEAVQLDASAAGHVREVRAWIERVAHLLEDERLLDEPEICLCHVEPAQLCELRPAVVLRTVPVAVERIALSEPRTRLRLQLLLDLVQREVHQRLLGRPSTRSATMFLRTSEVPASIVLPRERSCWWCHQPSFVIPSGPSSSRPSFVIRWFCSDQRSLTPEPSGPGMPVRSKVPSER